MLCNLAKKLVVIYQMNSTGWMLEFFLLLITVAQAAVKILPAGGIQGTLCNTYTKTWNFSRDCYSVNLNLGMGSGIPTIRYPNMEKYPDEFEIAETQMMIRPIRAKWLPKIPPDLLTFTIKEGYTDRIRPCSNSTDYGAVNNTNFHFYCYFLIMFARINEPNKLNVKLINFCPGLFFIIFCILENFWVDDLISFKWGRFSNSSKWPQSMTEIVRTVGWIPGENLCYWTSQV